MGLVLDIHGTVQKAFRDNAPDIGFDRICVTSGVDHHAAVGLPFGDA